RDAATVRILLRAGRTGVRTPCRSEEQLSLGADELRFVYRVAWLGEGSGHGSDHGQGKIHAPTVRDGVRDTSLTEFAGRYLGSYGLEHSLRIGIIPARGGLPRNRLSELVRGLRL